MPAPARKAQSKKATARAGMKRARRDPALGKLARAEAATRAALEEQAATAEILRVIARSPLDSQPVFETIARCAHRLCNARYAAVTRRVDDMLYLVAHTATTGVAHLESLFPARLTGQGAIGKAVLAAKPAWISDTETDPNYSEAFRAGARERGYRSQLTVPMLRNGEAIGAITVTHPQAREFPAQEIGLLQTFADQAVIAIENVRLFNETKEALEQQKASSEILGVISGSVEDAKPVFDAIVSACARLFASHVAGINIGDGREGRLAGSIGATGEQLRRMQSFADKVVREDGTAPPMFRLKGRPAHFPDIHAPGVPAVVREGLSIVEAKSVMFAPLRSEGRTIGAVWVGRAKTGAFSDKEIALLQSFADQAVIAIKNARLFNETKEALERQTATGEILKVIGRSTTDTQPVFEAIVRCASRLFAPCSAGIVMRDGNLVRLCALEGSNVDRAAREGLARVFPIPFDPATTLLGRCIAEGRVLHNADTEGPDASEIARRAGRAGHYRSYAVVPLMLNGEGIGVIALTHPEPGFELTEKQLSLVGTFADQAVIAIENARLFREIQDKSRQLEEASRHKSQFLASMSHELRTPLNAILGFNEMILGGIYGDVPGEMTEPLKDMQASGRHLLRLINNVLDLAKIEAGRMELALADYSVQDTVAGVHATLRPLAAEKGLDFVADVPPDIPVAHGDGGRITQCLMNLAGNSLKFTKTGRVAIAVQQENGLLRYSVTDTGIGIPPDKIASLFTEFKQTDATVASEFGGTGLGLSITKKFVEMHGGRIWVESEPGAGSAFRFEIPLRVSA
jgi:signal transduction histidine kinase